MSEHTITKTRAPWAAVSPADADTLRLPGSIEDRRGTYLGYFEYQEDADRAVACVNALAGIPNPGAALRGLAERMRDLLDLIDEHGYVDPHGEDVALARAALAPFDKEEPTK